MNLLLDTHVALWWFEGGKNLSADAIDVIRRTPIVYVSAVSVWELAIKHSLGKLKIPEPIEVGVDRSRFTQLPIAYSHATAVMSLPYHHADPFDRLLIAQSIVENAAIVTRDKQFKLYDCSIIWA
jgi:PIN domain nuclease of toxin-antitoxin system